jgi:TPR repeat protein
MDPNGPIETENSIGILYNNGAGVPKDPVEATRRFRNAAEQGSRIGMMNLAGQYEEGLGVPRDLKQARFWMQKAAACGNEYAAKWLAAHNYSVVGN